MNEEEIPILQQQLAELYEYRENLESQRAEYEDQRSEGYDEGGNLVR